MWHATCMHVACMRAQSCRTPPSEVAARVSTILDDSIFAVDLPWLWFSVETCSCLVLLLGAPPLLIDPHWPRLLCKTHSTMARDASSPPSDVHVESADAKFPIHASEQVPKRHRDCMIVIVPCTFPWVGGVVWSATSTSSSPFLQSVVHFRPSNERLQHR